MKRQVTVMALAAVLALETVRAAHAQSSDAILDMLTYTRSSKGVLRPVAPAATPTAAGVTTQINAKETVSQRKRNKPILA